MLDATGPSLRILILDDDSTMVELLSALFEHRGYRVTVARSGDAAIALLRDRSLRDPDQPFDLILSDLRMPGLQGRALASALRQVRGPATLLVGMSAGRPAPDELELLDAFLQKPFSTAEFQAVVELARAQRSAADEPAPAPGNTEIAGIVPDSGVLNRSIFESLRKALGTEQLRQLYEMTLKDTARRVDLMEGSAEAGDLASLRREAHSVRGSCGMVGATELHRLASAAEGGSLGDTPAIADFRSACQRLQRMLDEAFQA